MATFDVTDAFDPSFYDDMVVIRQVETITSKGRSSVAETSLGTKQAVIVPASPDDLARLPESTYIGKAISIHTLFRLQGPARDEAGVETQPDHVLWHDSVYEVRLLDDYSQYGRGFIHAVALSIEAATQPPWPDPAGNA